MQNIEHHVVTVTEIIPRLEGSKTFLTAHSIVLDYSISNLHLKSITGYARTQQFCPDETKFTKRPLEYTHRPFMFHNWS